MAEFNIEIIETLSRVVTVEAKTEADAIKQAKTLYDNEDIILEYNDFCGTEFKAVKR